MTGLTGLELNRLMIDAMQHGWPRCVDARIANFGKDIVCAFEGELSKSKAKYSFVLSLHDCEGGLHGLQQLVPGIMLLMQGIDALQDKTAKPNTQYSSLHVKLEMRIEGFGGIMFDRKYKSVEDMQKFIRDDVNVMFDGLKIVNSLPGITADYFGEAINAGKADK